MSSHLPKAKSRPVPGAGLTQACLTAGPVSQPARCAETPPAHSAVSDLILSFFSLPDTYLLSSTTLDQDPLSSRGIGSKIYLIVLLPEAAPDNPQVPLVHPRQSLRGNSVSQTATCRFQIKRHQPAIRAWLPPAVKGFLAPTHSPPPTAWGSGLLPVCYCSLTPNTGAWLQSGG